jgi:kynurenine formamidase
MRIIDLTLPLDEHTPAYTEPDGYRDPAYVAESWATLAAQGYSVHRLELGTHTGTHLDAPAHFYADGKTVDQIPPATLVGRAVVVDVRHEARVTAETLQPFARPVRGGRLPLLLAPEAGVPLSVEAVSLVAAWRPPLILYAGQFVDEDQPYHHNRVWLGASIPLVTDLALEATALVRDGDLLVVAPLHLVGMDGSPCRVFALRFGADDLSET